MFPYKSIDPLNLESRNQAKHIPVLLPSFPIKIWGNSVKGLPSYDRKKKLQLYIYYIYCRISRKYPAEKSTGKSGIP